MDSWKLIDGCLSTGKEANVYYAKAGRSAGWVTRSAGGDCDGSVSSSIVIAMLHLLCCFRLMLRNMQSRFTKLNIGV
jgi:hypothetical protein